MSKSRTKNSTRNAIVAMVSKIVHMLLSFACRTIFIQVLGADYLGLNGLFTNILQILSFAQLGIGVAIIYRMYKPVADGDRERIKTLVHFYKRAYSIIGITIFILGLALMPFLHLLIKDTPDVNENIYLIYLFFLIDSSISYFFAHKKSIISGHQKDYILSLMTLFVVVLQNVLQIIFLLTTHNYIVYLIIQIAATLLQNVLAARKADKMYPYIKDEKYQKISKREFKDLMIDVGSLVFYQVGSVLNSSTDNIVISAFVGVAEVGILSNYTLIIGGVRELIDYVFNSITSSIGNLNTIKDEKKKEDVFYQMMYILFIVYGFVSIMVALLMNKFIVIWLGGDYVMSMSISVVLALDLYIFGMRYINYTYRNTLGLFKKGAFVPFAVAIANVALSIILVQHIGVFGVLLATPLTRLILTAYEPYFIHKNAFGTSPLKYYKRYGYYMFVIVLAGVIAYFSVKEIPLDGVLGFIIDAVVITVIVLPIFWLFSFKTKPYHAVKQKILRLANKKL